MEESYSGNLDNYISKMSMELSAILNQFGAIEKSLSTTWDKVSKTIYEYSSFGGQLKRSNFFKDDLANILSGVEAPFDKASVIHSFVKSKVKWNGNYGFTS
ncbi:hypothetical protein Q2T40_05655 [Winogradskyella maritima]|nr:hypothetical protein [Winogradskyella maritima]